MGRAGPATFLLPDTELYPCFVGNSIVTEYLRSCGFHVWSLLLDGRDNFCLHRSCLVVTDHCCLLGQDVDHQGSSIVGTYSDEPLLAQIIRMTGLSSASSIGTTFACSEGVPHTQADQSLISCDGISRPVGPLRFKDDKHQFSASHSLHFLHPSQEVA